jgi:hypothetical protein
MVELCAGRAARLRSPGGGGGDGDFLKVGSRMVLMMLVLVRASGAVQTGLACGRAQPCLPRLLVYLDSSCSRRHSWDSTSLPQYHPHPTPTLLASLHLSPRLAPAPPAANAGDHVCPRGRQPGAEAGCRLPACHVPWPKDAWHGPRGGVQGCIGRGGASWRQVSTCLQQCCVQFGARRLASQASHHWVCVACRLRAGGMGHGLPATPSNQSAASCPPNSIVNSFHGLRCPCTVGWCMETVMCSTPCGGCRKQLT